METNRWVSVTVSEDTVRVIELRAEFAAVYNKMFDVIGSLKNKSDQDAEKLKDAMLDADAQIQHYLAKLIDSNLLESNFSLL